MCIHVHRIVKISSLDAIETMQTRKKDVEKNFFIQNDAVHNFFEYKTEQTLDLFHHKSNKPKEKLW